MTTTMITTRIWGTRLTVRADWAQAACAVERLADGEWYNTGRQVADYSHSAHAALRYECELLAIDSIDDGDTDDEIDAAIAAAKEVEEDGEDDFERRCNSYAPAGED